MTIMTEQVATMAASGFAEPEQDGIHRIDERFFICAVDDLFDLETLRRLQVTHILNCAGEDIYEHRDKQSGSAQEIFESLTKLTGWVLKRSETPAHGRNGSGVRRQGRDHAGMLQVDPGGG